ncbi:hypothetical protein B0F90DRAFT_1743532 [Multifurca ochricompacta]|uniref:Uncharacterized protein n=1 Tax=Multifurca ochricompacta TaxID=376703 RepID=A0AAD4QLK5_9AGAM|nr:hypothetical protein B0F90DRAFT_1743532 [Multifurca ochricompacta]
MSVKMESPFQKRKRTVLTLLGLAFFRRWRSENPGSIQSRGCVAESCGVLISPALPCQGRIRIDKPALKQGTHAICRCYSRAALKARERTATNKEILLQPY